MEVKPDASTTTTARFYKAVKRWLLDTGEVWLLPIMDSKEVRHHSFQVGGTYHVDDGEAELSEDPPRLCERGFHACSHPAPILLHPYGYTRDDALLEVRFDGPVVTDGVKTAGLVMTVMRETTWQQAFAETSLEWTCPLTRSWFTFNAQGRLHSFEGAPAYVDIQGGVQMWFQDGELHRDEDEPTVVRLGSCKWYRRTKPQRAADTDIPLFVDLPFVFCAK